MSTKLAAKVKDHEGARAVIAGSLETLGLDHIDLMLIHSPQPWDDFRGGDYAEGNREAWRAMEEAYEAGTLRAIGVSNFEPSDLENLLVGARITPHANQVLAHISNTPFELMAYCASRGILVEAYSPIAHRQIPEIAAVAQRYGVTVPQLCIRYVLQLGAVALPKTANPDHMRGNAAVDFAFTADDMAVLRDAEPIEHYGEAGAFPVFAGR